MSVSNPTSKSEATRPILSHSASNYANGLPAPPITPPQNDQVTSEAVLELADGTAFRGISFGAEGKSVAGECVFQTGEYRGHRPSFRCIAALPRRVCGEWRDVGHDRRCGLSLVRRRVASRKLPDLGLRCPDQARAWSASADACQALRAHTARVHWSCGAAGLCRCRRTICYTYVCSS